MTSATSPSRADPFPIALIVWAAASVALNIGLHRFTYGVMLPALRRDLELDYLASGTLNAVHLAAYLAGTLTAPILVKRLGPARLAGYAHLLVAVGAVACALAPQTPVLGVGLLGLGRVATGLGAGGAILSAMLIALGSVSAVRRPAVSALVWAGMGVAIIGSALAISFLLGPSIGWRSAFAATALVALALAIFTPASPPPVAPAPAAEGGFRFRAVLTRRWVFLVTAYMMFGAGYIAYSTFAGARMAAAGASPAVAGAMWATLGVASMVGAGLTILVLKRPRLEQASLAIGLGLAAAGTALSTLESPAAALAGALLVGLGFASAPSIVSAQARERSSAETYASAFSFATAALGLGQLVGPVAAGGLADWFGTVAAPLFAALAYGIGTVSAIIDIGMRKAPER